MLGFTQGAETIKIASLIPSKKERKLFLGKGAKFRMVFTPDDRQQTETGTHSLIQLVLRAQAGQQNAFEDLYKQYFKHLCNYLTLLIGDNGVACELAQETFVKAWQNLLRLREPASFASISQQARH